MRWRGAYHIGDKQTLKLACESHLFTTTVHTQSMAVINNVFQLDTL